MGTTDTKIFDKDTLLDLTVNIIPLGILLFFTAYILIIDPWNMASDPLIMVVTLGLHVVPFVALAVLTYLSGKAIAGSEKEGEVFLAGRASVSGAQPLETEHHGHGDESGHAEIGDPDDAATAAAEGDADAAEKAAEGEDESDTGTPDRTGAEGRSGTEEQIEPGTTDEAETKTASESVDADEDESAN